MSEFPRPISITDIDRRPRTHTIEPTAEEIPALAKRLGVSRLTNISASLTVTRKRGAVRVEGQVTADVEQLCVVTLEPLQSKVSEPIEETYMEVREDEHAVEIDVDPDSPEPLEGDELDIGELAAQYLALAIDPHPRAPGADLAALEVPEESKIDPTHPFAALRNLQRDR